MKSMMNNNTFTWWWSISVEEICSNLSRARNWINFRSL